MKLLDFYSMDKAIEYGASVLYVSKYKAFGEWSVPKAFEPAKAKAKAQVVVYDDEGVAHCPYRVYIDDEALEKKFFF